MLISVGFVDLTGYTTLTEEEGDRQALAYARQLERLVRSASHAHDMRIVKRLGDGFMVGGSSVAEMLSGLLYVVRAAAERDDMPTARAGVAFGSAVSRGGDYFGHTVNLAARVLDQADPSEVLVTDDCVEQARSGPFTFHEPRDATSRHPPAGAPAARRVAQRPAGVGRPASSGGAPSDLSFRRRRNQGKRGLIGKGVLSQATFACHSDGGGSAPPATAVRPRGQTEPHCHSDGGQFSDGASDARSSDRGRHHRDSSWRRNDNSEVGGLEVSRYLRPQVAPGRTCRPDEVYLLQRRQDLTCFSRAMQSRTCVCHSVKHQFGAAVL